MKIKRLIFALVAIILILSSCTPHSDGIVLPSMGSGESRFTLEEDKIADFSLGSPEGFWARDDRGNGHPFNCSFRRDHAVIADGKLTLALTKRDDGGFAGAEYRNWERCSFGFYSVKMKAASCSGVISSFFTYTGRPWDEIDIEFLGDDTTRVQFNYFKNGVGGHEYVYDLGFDASEDFHEYAFDWQADSITWYVDGKAVYKVVGDMPQAPGNIMVNLWNVADSDADWAGKFHGDDVPVYAEYLWFGYQPAHTDAEDK